MPNPRPLPRLCNISNSNSLGNSSNSLGNSINSLSNSSNSLDNCSNGLDSCSQARSILPLVMSPSQTL